MDWKLFQVPLKLRESSEAKRPSREGVAVDEKGQSKTHQALSPYSSTSETSKKKKSSQRQVFLMI